MSLARTILDIMGQKQKQLNMTNGGAKNNNQTQSKPDSPSASTSNSPKSSQNGKPSVLLKSTPDAFYNKKNNNNVNKKDILKSQITNGSPSQSQSGINNSLDGREVNNVQNSTTNIRRNSDTNEHITTNKSQEINNRLRKQNSVDSNQKISSNNIQKIIGFATDSRTSQTKERVNDQKSSQNSVDKSIKSSNECNTTLTSDDAVSSNKYNNIEHNPFKEEHHRTLENGDNQISEDAEDLVTNVILNEILRDVSEENLSESASVVVKSQKFFPLCNKISDASDNENSEDSYSITASFEIKEADSTVQNHDDTVTYLPCPENKLNETEKQCNSDDKSINESRVENTNGVHETIQEDIDDLRNEEFSLKSVSSKTEQIELKSEIEQDKPNNYQELNSTENSNIGKTNEEEKLENSKIECSIPEVSKCPDDIVNDSENKLNYEKETEIDISDSDQIETHYNSNDPVKTNSIEETKESIDEEVIPQSTNDVTPISETEEEEEQQRLKSQEIDVTDQNKSNIKEEEETESEEESEGDDEDKASEEKIKEVKLENNIANPTDVIQMETSDVIVEPKPKIKKFVRFALIHNTYHGSDTESEEDEEEEEAEEEEEEESDEEEEEVEEGDDEVKDGAVASKVEESKPVDIVQIPEPDVEIIQPIDVELKLETTNPGTDNIPTAAPITEPVKDPFENERLNYEHRIRDLLSEKSSHEDRIHNLISDLELKQLEQNQLKGKIGELENQVLTKTWAMDRQEAEMTSAMKESEHLRNKLMRLEDNLTEYRLKNSDLTEELVRKVAEENKRKEETCDFFKIRELEEKLCDANDKIKYLEGELNDIKRNQEIAKEADNIKKADTEVEMKIMREALDEALKQKSILQKRFESEFNQLRNVNTAQEQQLLDDFEWKLREVEQSCKKKILEADKCKRDLEAQVSKLTAEVEELSKFKNAEAELAQLRSVSHEQLRTIRTITRQKEELQVNEKILNEEMSRLRASLEKEKTHIATLQAIHSREITEKNRKHQFKLDQQKVELQEQFEERLKKETLRTKVDCEKHHLEDKRVAVEHTRAQGESKLQEHKKKWEKQLQEAQHQAEVLRERVKESERVHRQEVESAVTHSDQSMLEMRRKFDKLDMSYQEQIEKAQERHEQEIEHLNEEYERRLAQCEASWQQQLSTTRTTLELVKEQMRRDAYDQIQHMKTQHQRELEEQWSRLIQERDEALAELEQRHRTTIESLRTEIEIRSKKSNAESELKERVKQLQQELDARNRLIESLQSTQVIPSQAQQQLRAADKRKRTSSERQRTVSGSEQNGEVRVREDQHQKVSKSASTSQMSPGPSHTEHSNDPSGEHAGNTAQPKPSRRKRNRNRNRQ